MYLFDSGAQVHPSSRFLSFYYSLFLHLDFLWLISLVCLKYLDGTTDITRTVHFGKPTSHEKSCYTVVCIVVLYLLLHICLRTKGMLYIYFQSHGCGFPCVHMFWGGWGESFSLQTKHLLALLYPFRQGSARLVNHTLRWMMYSS